MKLYLGLDSSTQGLKGIIIAPATGEIIFSEQIIYGRDLPEYGCPNGVLENANPLIKHAPPLMWVAALDLLFHRMQRRGAPLKEIAAISGSAQQHGSVYLNDCFPDILANLRREEELACQIAPALSRPTAPIWMDSSTTAECAALTAAFGERIQLITGSPATERFTAPQIRKFYREEPQLYAETATIHLVSSFMASILIGENAPLDYGDGAGMNLLDLKKWRWDRAITEFTAPGLLQKLPQVVSSATVAGNLHPYFTRYGLPPAIPVVAWSGDNPCSLTGCGATSETAVISFGTSDTFFTIMDKFTVDPQGYGHLFGNQAGGVMSLTCFKNGSLARERIKDEAGVDWTWFGNEAFALTPPGNDGNMLLPFFVPEITPLTMQPLVKRRGSRLFCSGQGSPAANIRAVVEAQVMNMKLHTGWTGKEFTAIRVTGGASRSAGLCQTVADIFQCPVEKIAVPDSAALGSAMWAATVAGQQDLKGLQAKFCSATEIFKPDSSTASLYETLLEEFAEFLNSNIRLTA